MTLDIWGECQEQLASITLTGNIFRVVESQEKVATNALVDTLEEQALLEDMIEQTKPAIPSFAHDFSYLLFTPFRYPPLKHGSRFGGRFEPGLFYGSRTLTTALAETAFYRLHFWFDMSVPPPAGKIKTQHTAFTAQIKTDKGLKLQTPPFSKFEMNLTDKTSYGDSQKLGTSMRENNIEAFESLSARDVAKGLNIGLFKPTVLSEKNPGSVISLFCSTDKQGVEFMDEEGVVYHYWTDDFLDNGDFPRRA